MNNTKLVGLTATRESAAVKELDDAVRRELADKEIFRYIRWLNWEEEENSLDPELLNEMFGDQVPENLSCVTVFPPFEPAWTRQPLGRQPGEDLQNDVLITRIGRQDLYQRDYKRALRGDSKNHIVPLSNEAVASLFDLCMCLKTQPTAGSDFDE